MTGCGPSSPRSGRPRTCSSGWRRAKAGNLALAASEEVVRLLEARLPDGLRATAVGSPRTGDGQRPTLFAIAEADATFV